ncbi:hypothetical protein QT917_000770 [Xanthomonas campestris pv. campestris]|uniref:hypothetical protein n=1 Tax=Xanthomonas campestris TaxID=339 RepID=UPI0025A3017B|nr:hypothetical protein [Xanthomonas campestris]MDM7702391.1 hypothetical protein [Xanthomonas campestris pv. campestris]MEA0907763.1 hypothetical protein [Xanthomonas campestris pv. campestris]MEB1944853.1 hypothetical protein [Xanthomonas campestris pv. campestris]
MKQPSRLTRWLDRLANVESRASNRTLWALILIFLGAGMFAAYMLEEEGFLKAAIGFAVFAVALFPFETRFSEHPTFATMGIVPADSPDPSITFGCYEYYDAKKEPIPEMVVQYREFNRAKFIHFPLGMFLCMSADWIGLAIT